jgi:hypothetical protein
MKSPPSPGAFLSFNGAMGDLKSAIADGHGPPLADFNGPGEPPLGGFPQAIMSF